MTTLKERLGERIRYIRKDKGLSQEELGELSGLHTNYIGQVERGNKNLTVESLEKITFGLGITLEQLFRHLDPMQTKDETSQLLELLESRSSIDKALMLSLAKSVFDWEAQKQGKH